MPQAAHLDCTLRVRSSDVAVACQHCEWAETLATAPPGMDLIRAARLAAFEHCWTAHRIHAWDVSFRAVR